MKVFSSLFGATLLSVCLMSSPVLAGDCAKTVMGGGCSSEVASGVAAHMRSQVPAPAANNQAAANEKKPATSAANTKVSASAEQKPKI
ncbi:MAG: hypothetical protein ACXW1P_00350 [Methylophilaceae bacterium]